LGAREKIGRAKTGNFTKHVTANGQGGHKVGVNDRTGRTCKPGKKKKRGSWVKLGGGE